MTRKMFVWNPRQSIGGVPTYLGSVIFAESTKYQIFKTFVIGYDILKQILSLDSMGGRPGAIQWRSLCVIRSLDRQRPNATPPTGATSGSPELSNYLRSTYVVIWRTLTLWWCYLVSPHDQKLYNKIILFHPLVHDIAKFKPSENGQLHIQLSISISWLAIKNVDDNYRNPVSGG